MITSSFDAESYRVAITPMERIMIKTRVGPSPTGDPHIGTAYVALMNYLFAKKHGGKFVLRIEDTDASRSTPEAERMILDALRWLKLDWDEGPIVGGDEGPYRQSERSELYRHYANVLVQKGGAFKCFCGPTELQEMRNHQRASGLRPRYDGRCLHLTDAARRAKEAAGVPYVIRLVIPSEGVAHIRDDIRGDITIGWDAVDMQILLKTDGMPTYYLANVVDDHLMGITNILRGEEWIPSAPKHILLYSYLQWEMPRLAHLPLLRNPDRSKLSKRKNPTGINFFRRMGYMPEVLLSFLGTLTIPMVADGEDELLDINQMIERFDLTSINISGPVFDIEKLSWLNGRYMRERLTTAQFASRVAEWAVNPTYLTSIAELAQPRITKLSDLGLLVDFLFAGRIPLSEAELLSIKFTKEDLRRTLFVVLQHLDSTISWTAANIELSVRGVADTLDIKIRDLSRPLYLIISGKPTSLPLFKSMQLLGRDICRQRIRDALDTLGSPSAKEREQWLVIIANNADAAEVTESSS